MERIWRDAMRRMSRVAALAALLLLACEGDDDDQSADAAVPGPDASELDASANPADASVSDARVFDAPVFDAPVFDAPTDNCFYSDKVLMTVPFLGAQLVFEDADVAAEYVGDPATGMLNVLIRGFMSEADAQATIVQLPILGATPLSDLLPGGTGCNVGHDDRDLGPDGVTMGWWFYFNGTAVEVSYIGP